MTVVLPCRNEDGFIGPCLDSILEATYPASLMEILVVDGRSDDGTRRTVERYAAEHGNLRLVDNPDRWTPHAVNRGIREARGEVIVRMDAHAVYPPDYIERCVRGLRRYDADNVGGVWDTRPRDDTVRGRAIAAVHSHPFGVGDAWFRVGVDEPREVDTVPFGCYRRETLLRLGGYDERLRRAQDFELNARLLEEGGRIVLDPEVRAAYLVRSTVGEVTFHRLRSGFWTIYALQYESRSLAPRHCVPLAALLTALGLGIGHAAGAAAAGTALLLLVGLYVILDLASAARIGLEERSPGVAAWSAILFPLLHGVYALGQLAALPVTLGRWLHRRLGGLTAAPDASPGAGSADTRSPSEMEKTR